ncbi:STAS domain-containing protein [Spirillospora sp. NPDC052242]
MALTIDRSLHEEDLAVVVLSGDIDVATSPRLRGELITLIASGVRHLVLDLRAVFLIDSRGLDVLVAIQRHLHRHGGSVVLTAPSRQVRTVLRTTQLTKVFPIYGSTDVALHLHRSEQPTGRTTGDHDPEPESPCGDDHTGNHDDSLTGG